MAKRTAGTTTPRASKPPATAAPTRKAPRELRMRIAIVPTAASISGTMNDSQ